MSIPKAVLYYSPDSVWSNAVSLVLAEKGYADDELDRKVVDLDKGENFSVSFLRINPEGTVPVLVVPFEDSLSADDAERRYKSVIRPEAIIALLDKSRSPLSKTRTTSSAPAPLLTPATVEYKTLTDKIQSIVHASNVSVDTLASLNAHDDASLSLLAKARKDGLIGQRDALRACLDSAASGQVQASEKVRKFWQAKLSEVEFLVDVLDGANSELAGLDTEAKARREDLYERGSSAWRSTKSALQMLNQTMIGPFSLGDQLSLADVSVAAWLEAVVRLAGGNQEEDAASAIAKLETVFKEEFPKEYDGTDSRGQLGKISKLAAFWDAIRKRPGWRKM